jgi:outer membrane immunogenic protein
MQGYSRIASVTCSIAFGVCALAGVASAADLPSRNSAPIAPIMVAPPIFTWTGFYAGVNLGYDFAQGNKADPFFGKNGVYKNDQRDAFQKDGAAFSEKSQGGVMGGAQAGYNYQLGQVVLGVEADVQKLSLSRTATMTSNGLGNSGTMKQTLGGMGTLRGRIGYAFDRALVYGTAGYGIASSSDSYVSNDKAAEGTTGQIVKHNGYLGGLVVGGGVEYAVTDNVSVKGEYLYADLKPLNKSSVDGVGYVTKDVKASIVRAGVNYKF